jgi:D-alanine-D-alanine ligase
MNKTIGITFDLKKDRPVRLGDPLDMNAEFDSEETLGNIIRAIESGGHKVKKIGHVYNLLSQIDQLGVDIVFNICEGYNGRNRESQVPILLELNDIPYVGSDALTLGLTLDKVMAKKCFLADGIPTPKYFVAESVDDLKDCHLDFPLIVKCRSEGTSKGLTRNSRVEDFESLKTQVDFICTTYKQSALVEEFIKGTEFTVPVIGNEKPEAFPVVQVSIDGNVNLGDEFYSFERVSSNTLRYVCPAKVSDALKERLTDLAIRAYKSVDCRDLGRIDFRVDERENPYVLEINPLPSLSLEDVFNIAPKLVGSSYEKVINRVIEFALKRYGLTNGQMHNSQQEAGRS